MNVLKFSANLFWSAANGKWRIVLPLRFGKRIHYGLQARVPWLRIARA